jgi:virginiamycin B lyase
MNLLALSNSHGSMEGMTTRAKKIVSLSTSLGLVVSGFGFIATTSGAHAATGDVVPFGLATANSAPEGIALDTSGNMWIAMSGVDQIGKSTITGVISTVDIPNGAANAGAHAVTLGSDSRMWVTERLGNRIGVVNPENNQYQAFDIPTANSQPMGITAGPDGATWFTEFAADKIGRITKAGAITEFVLPADSGPTSIVTGPDGALWITLQKGNAIGRMTTTGVLTPYALPNTNSAPTDITVGTDNNLWFTERSGNRVGRMTVRGVLAEFTLPTANSTPEQITLGASGELWVTQPGANRVSRIITAGVVTEYILPTANTAPFGVVSGIDGNIWFTGKTANNLNRLLSGVVPTAKVDPTLAATSTTTGSTITANPGTWNYAPTTYTYQWERCNDNTNTNCSVITGATATTYVLTEADASKFLRVAIKATNLNGTSATTSTSARLVIDGLPPKLPPTPVAGGQTVQLIPGTTATLKGAKVIKRGKSKLFRVLASNNAVKGKVRMTLVNPAGLEVFVIAKGKWINPSGKAKKIKRIPATLPAGLYTLRAVYTPKSDLTTVYPVATMSKPLRLK